jgi:hypothetical protein
MKQYPHVEYYPKGIMNEHIFAFNKLDGSNIRCEFSRKRGFYKFGTKKCIIDETHEQFGNAVTIFLEKYNEDLSRIFCSKEYRNFLSVVVFSEYFGENSFAGFHQPDDKMNIVLFDVDLYKKGLLKPKEFINDFGHLHIPDVIYDGNLNKEFINNVKENVYNLKEGVMCKGFRKTKGQDIVWMVKVKTNDWLDRLKNKYGDKALVEEFNNEL